MKINNIKKNYFIFLILLMIGLLLLSCQKADQTNKESVINLTLESELYSGTANHTDQGIVFDSTIQKPEFKMEGIEHLLSGNGIVRFEIMNSTDLEELSFSFITIEDSHWTNFKKANIDIEKSDDYIIYELDLSGQYGWLGTLNGIGFSCSSIDEGSITIKSVTIAKGGASFLDNITVGPEEILYTFRERAAKGIGESPDGILGMWKNDDGGLSFVGSNLGKIFVSDGTAEDPFENVRYYLGRMEGVDFVEYKYASVAQVLKDEESGLLVGIAHFEEYLDFSIKTMEASLGLAVSDDDGNTWTRLGEIVRHHFPKGEAVHMTRDIGNGTILTKDGYVYVYATDFHKERGKGLSVSRALISDVFDAAKSGVVPEFKKYKDGEWEEAGIGGDYTNVLPQQTPNFHYIQYNYILDKYIIVTTESPYYTDNDGDISMLISDDFLDWSNAEKMYIATGKRGEQYPTMISFEDDPQTSSGSEFYIYYCSWNAYDEEGKWSWNRLWATSNYIRRKVTVTK